MNTPIHYDVIIIGAGAAGLMCAIEAGKRGRRVLVLDHANRAGKKILMSGGGRCNFTNLDVAPKHYLSQNPHFCKSALSRYTPNDFIALVKRHRIPFHEKAHGQLFCDNKSQDIVDLLLKECDKAGVHIQLQTTIESIKKAVEQGFCLTVRAAGARAVSTERNGDDPSTARVLQTRSAQDDNRGKGDNATRNGRAERDGGHRKLMADSVVVATGGLSIPTMGASPFGYQLAEQFSLKVLPTRASLVPLTLHDHDKARLAELSGVSVPCTAEAGRTQFVEDMLFTHRGVSGPAILQISNYWEPGAPLQINLLPQHDVNEVIQTVAAQYPKRTLKTVLHELLPKRVVSLWLDEDTLNTPVKQLSHKRLESIASAIHAWALKPNGTEGYRTAEVTLGGVDTDALSSKTFEAKSVPGLFFIGEVVDVTGWLGGYNFQWAWASGWAAGQVV